MDHDVSVRVEAGDHKEQYIVEDTLCLSILSGYQGIGDTRSRLGSAHFAGVKSHGLTDHGLALFHV